MERPKKRCPDDTPCGSKWRESNVISQIEQNSVWREVLSMGSLQLIPKGRRWTESLIEDTFSFLDKGRIQMSSLGKNGGEHIVLTIGPGCIFCELACMKVAPINTTSFLALEDCEVWHFPRSLLQDEAFTREHPLLMMNLVNSLMQKAGAFSCQLDESVALSPLTMVCRYLFRSTEECGQVFRPRFTQSDLALSLGLHRSTVCRILHDLRERGILGDFTRKRLEILDVDGLYALCLADRD